MHKCTHTKIPLLTTGWRALCRTTPYHHHTFPQSLALPHVAPSLLIFFPPFCLFGLLTLETASLVLEANIWHKHRCSGNKLKNYHPPPSGRSYSHSPRAERTKALWSSTRQRSFSLSFLITQNLIYFFSCCCTPSWWFHKTPDPLPWAAAASSKLWFFFF